MRELLRRSITGGLYIALLLGTVFLSPNAFEVLFLIFGLICLYEFKRIVQLKGYFVFITYIALWWAFIYFFQHKGVLILLSVLTLTVNMALLWMLFTKKSGKFTEFQKFIIAVFYLGGGCIFLTMIPSMEHNFDPFLIMGIFILIWVNDSLAYAVGCTIGRTPLYSAVSPKKTVEGALGGLIFAGIAACILSRHITTLSLWEWLCLATVIVVAGNLGDLLESKFKRMAGVKDSGALLPGHGGLWDRLDSLVFAAPFAYVVLNLFL